MSAQLPGKITLLLGALALAMPSFGVTIPVTNTLDTGPGSLRQGLLDAQDSPGPDTLDFAIPHDGPYVIVLESTLIIQDDVAIEGGGQVILSGNDQVRVIDVVSGTVELQGLTITGGRSWYGAGVQNNGTLTLTDCTIRQNRAEDVPRNLAGDLSYAAGAGILNLPTGNMTLRGCAVTDNVAYSIESAFGAGINNLGRMNLEDCDVSSNRVDGHMYGEGAGLVNYGMMTLTHCNIEGNLASAKTRAYGGGVRNYGFFGAIGSSLYGNIVMCLPEAGGGSLYNSYPGFVFLFNTTVSGNMVSSINLGMGGGILNDGAMYLANNTITHNDVYGETASGGGLYNTQRGQVHMTNTILGGNLVRRVPGGDCFNNARFEDLGYNLVGDGTCITHETSLSGDPCLGPMADNGGRTMTHMLLPDSPAIDAGDCAGDTMTEDQRGIGRPDGMDCDIGALELVDGDDDDDGVPDEEDGCPIDPLKIEPGQCGCHMVDTDTDSDGKADCRDACPTVPSAQPDGCAHGGCEDVDGDGVCDDEDNCPEVANINQADADEDGVGDRCDNCPAAANEDQADGDADGAGDACDPLPPVDTDGDGVADDVDKCPDTPEESDVDEFGCALSQLDSDEDGVTDDVDECPSTPAGEDVGDDGCTTVVPPVDRDGDGFPDALDNCPDDANPDQRDSDNDGLGDVCDDTDNENDNGDGHDVPDIPNCGSGMCGTTGAIMLWPIVLGLMLMRRRN